MVDFTAPETVVENVRAALERGIPCVVGTTGWEPSGLSELAEEKGVALFYAPNFAIGAVLMMRFAAEAARHLPRRDRRAPRRGEEGRTFRHRQATAERMGGAEIHSVRLPGLVAHQEVLFGGDGQLLTIRHDAQPRGVRARRPARSREAPEPAAGPHGGPGGAAG